MAISRSTDSSIIGSKKNRRIKVTIQEGTIINKRLQDEEGNDIPFAGWLVDIKINENSYLWDVPFYGGTINIDSEEYDDFYGVFVPPKIKSKVFIVWEKGMPFAPYVIQTFPFPWRVDRDEQDDDQYSLSHFEDLFTRLKDDGELDDIFISNKKGSRLSLKDNGDVELSSKTKDGDNFKKSQIQIERETGNIRVTTGEEIKDDGNIVNEINIYNENESENSEINIIQNKGNDDNEITVSISEGTIYAERTGSNANGEKIELSAKTLKAVLNDNVKLEMSSESGSEKITAQTSSNYKIEIDEASSKVKINNGTDGQAAARKGDGTQINAITHSQFIAFLTALATHTHSFVPSTQTVGTSSELSPAFVGAFASGVDGEITEGSDSVKVGGVPS